MLLRFTLTAVDDNIYVVKTIPPDSEPDNDLILLRHRGDNLHSDNVRRTEHTHIIGEQRSICLTSSRGWHPLSAQAKQRSWIKFHQWRYAWISGRSTLTPSEALILCRYRRWLTAVEVNERLQNPRWLWSANRNLIIKPKINRVQWWTDLWSWCNGGFTSTLWGVMINRSKSSNHIGLAIFAIKQKDFLIGRLI
jgi:hypothetical protein